MSIDPLSQKYPYNSTYAFQENKMGMGRELEGLELVEIGMFSQTGFSTPLLGTNEVIATEGMGEIAIPLENIVIETAPRTSIWESIGNFLGDVVKAFRGGSDVKADLIPQNAMEKAVDNAKPATPEPTARGAEGKLEKSPRGAGTVAPADRDKKRVPTTKEKAKEREANDNKCANCGNETKAEDTRSHHYPERHADGVKEKVPVCKDCHTYLHSKD